MTIKNITLIPNEKLPKKQQPIREKMDIYIPNVPEGLSRRNGMIYCLVGSGGSGKTSLLLNMFKSTKYYRSKFHSIFYICPNASFSSIEKHPFSDMTKYIMN
jgi:Cdc6-like AAA superfamily ATPase